MACCRCAGTRLHVRRHAAPGKLAPLCLGHPSSQPLRPLLNPCPPAVPLPQPLLSRRSAVLSQGRNLVYCAPTSGGKSLVAEVLMLRRVLTTGRPAMVVLPFVSICSEKSEHLG